MGDEERSKQLPQRERGAARAGPRPLAPPVLPAELRQRLQAAVVAERAAVESPDEPAPAEPSPPTARSDPGRNGIGRARPSGPPVVPAELRQRLQAAVVAERAAAVRPDQPAPAEASRPATRSGPGRNGIGRAGKSAVRPQPVRPHPVRTELAANGSAGHEPAVPVEDGPAPEQRASARKKPVRSRLLVALVVIVAGALGIAVSLYYAKAPARTPAAARDQELIVRDQAAAWVAQQVSHSAIVACDPLMCAPLVADGFPAGQLRVLGPTAPVPTTSAVVVVTAAVRHIFGTSLSSYWAPAVLAAFGSGSAEIAVRVVAPHGAAAYHTAASADLAARVASGDALLKVSDVAVSAVARKQLLAGQVDSRLMLALADLAADEPIGIVDFGNLAPGEDPDVPLRFADLVMSGQAATGGSAYVRSVVADLGAVTTQFRPASTKIVVLPGGQKLLRVQFTAPSPLGLLGT
jgi:hypothetical protein